MRSGQTKKRELKLEVTTALSTVNVLADMLTGASESPWKILEGLYYAAEDDLIAIMRLTAALDTADRAKVYEYAKALHDDHKLLGSP